MLLPYAAYNATDDKSTSQGVPRWRGHRIVLVNAITLVLWLVAGEVAHPAGAVVP